MQTRITTRSTLAAAATILARRVPLAADKPAVDQAALDKAFEALKTFNWGPDRKLLVAIDEAVPATHGDAAARKALETRLAAVLSTGAVACGQGLCLPQADGRSARPRPCRRWPRCCPTRNSRTWPAMPWSESRRPRRPQALARRAAEAQRQAQGRRDRLAGRPPRRGEHRRPGRALGDADAAVARWPRPWATSARRQPLGRHRHCAGGRGLSGHGSCRGQAGRCRRPAGRGRTAVGQRQEGRGWASTSVLDDEPKNVRLAATRGLLHVGGKKD